MKDGVDLDNLRAYIGDISGFWGIMFGKGWTNTISGFADTLFQFTGVLYQIFDFVIDKLYSMNILSQLNHVITELTNNIWQTLKNNYVGLILLFSFFSIIRKFLLENAKEAVLFLGKILLVLVVSGLWFPNASTYLNKMNDVSFEFQAEVLRIAGQTDETSVLSTENGNTSEGTATEIIRNELFRQTMYRPFLLLNYGTTNAEKINAMYAKVKNEEIPKDTNGKYLASKEFGKLDSKKQKQQLKDLAKHNKYLTGEKAGFKFIISIVSIFGVFLMGIPLTVLAFVNVFLQLLTILYQYILPLVAIVSLLPRYSDGLINSIGNIVKIYLSKGVLAMAILLFCLINTTIDLLIPPENFIPVLGNIFVKGFVYLLLWKSRHFILRSLMSALSGRGSDVMVQMQQGSQEFFQQGLDKVSDMKDSAISGAQSAALMAAGMPPELALANDSTGGEENISDSTSEEEKDEDNPEQETLLTQEEDTNLDGMDDETSAEESEFEHDLQQEADQRDAINEMDLPDSELEVQEELDQVEEADPIELEELNVPDIPDVSTEDNEEIPIENVPISETTEKNKTEEEITQQEVAEQQEQRQTVTQNYEKESKNGTSSPTDEKGNTQKVSNSTVPKSETPVQVYQQFREGDKNLTINQKQHNEQHAHIDVKNQTTNRIRGNEFERLLRKYRGTGRK
ncbi:hypothetical protein G8B32_10775 [Enterococcus faecalis]|nr:hypothetical protein [Enterococcus faecalis]MBE9855102.1 hypothetical protein [Enterococcus faecalis]